MLTITEAAYARLSELLADRSQDVAVRIVLDQGRTRIRPSRPRQGDEILAHQGRTLLLLDEQVSSQLNDRTLGTRQTKKGPRLRLR